MKDDNAVETVAAELLEAEKEKFGNLSNQKRVSDLDESKHDALTLYNDGLPYDRDRIITEIRFFMVQTVQGFLEMGKRLVVLKEMERHGNFYKCLDELGIQPRSAWNYMAAAKKFTNLKRVSELKIVNLNEGVGKLYALLDVSDEELQEFEETGELRGLTMDEIDALPVKEVRARLRKRNTQVEQGMLQLKEANAKIDRLEEEVRDLKWPKRSEYEDRFVSRMENLKKMFDGYMLQVEPEHIKELQFDADPEPSQRMKAAYISTIQYMRMQILSAYDMASQLHGDAISMPEEAGIDPRLGYIELPFPGNGASRTSPVDKS